MANAQNIKTIRLWTKFHGRPHSRYSSKESRVTIAPKGVIRLNKQAWSELGSPDAVELMFDQPNRIIGIAPTDPKHPDAFPVKDMNNCTSKMIRASAFCTHFLIRMMRTGLFNHVEIDEKGIMNLHLDTLTAVTRGAR